MSQYPLNELKRRLQDDTPLPKRLKLARNVVQTQYFPTAPKERVIADWLDDLIKTNKLKSKDLCEVLNWLNNVDDFTSEFKSKLIKVVSQYLHRNVLENNDIENIIAFMDNSKMSPQLILQIEDFLFIVTTLLQNLHNEENYTLVDKILNNIVRYYKDSKKKLQFIIGFLEGEHLETIFCFLHTKSHSAAISLCQNVLFPLSKKQIFSSFLTNLIRKETIDDLIAEKGDNIQIVLKIMSSFFTFPKGRTEKDPKFLSDFIYVFTSCFRSESQLCFTFYIMATNAFNMAQNYMVPAMRMPPITFDNDDKVKRGLFLKMLEALHSQEISLSVRFTDTLGERMTHIDIKKTFAAFVQAVMLGQIKLQGKLDKVTLQILEVALKLDPSIVEQKTELILPYIMTSKKKKSDISEQYTSMMNYFIETLFKLSRGAEFVNKIIPHIKLSLEATNVEQFELKQKLKEALNNGDSSDKIEAAILTGNDILPPDCVELYGKLSSELMFRQNKVLLVSLQKDFEENCLMMLEEGFVSPSIITLSEVLSAILSSFFRHNKMADHTVPLPVAEEFWSTFQEFEKLCLNKFGECVLKLNYNPPLVMAFLQLCLNFSQLKLLNLKYGNTKLNLTGNILIPFMNTQKWLDFIPRIQEAENILVWDHLQLIQTMAMEILNTNSEQISETKTNILKNISSYPQVVTNDNYFTNTLYRNLNKRQTKILTKAILKNYSTNNNIGIFKTHAVSNNRELLQSILLKVSKNITDCIGNVEVLSEALNKTNFEVNSFVKWVNVRDLFKNGNIINEDEISNNIDILRLLQIHNLKENYQLTAILVLLLAKHYCQHKKLKRNIDSILHSIYELSPKYPDVYKIFQPDAIFDFNNNIILELLRLNIKTTKDTLIMKNVIEIAVKKVKTDPDVIKNIVEILLRNHKTSEINNLVNFDNPVFEIICLALPVIAREKKNITTSAYRSILADLQEKLNTAMLDSFRNLNFNENVENENSHNSMLAYSLTLLKFCESSEINEKDVDCMLSGLEYYIDIAINSLQEPSSITEHIETSINLINITLRYLKRLTLLMKTSNKTNLLADTDKFYHRLWVAITCRLSMVFDKRQKRRISNNCIDEIAVMLKFLAELSSVECFCNHFVGDLSKLALLKNPSFILKNDEITNSQITARRVYKYLWQNCLKANIIEAKCVAMTKIIFRSTKNIKHWIWQHYDNIVQNGPHEVVVDDSICELLRNDLDTLCDVIMAAKKINLDYKFLDSIFELAHLYQYLLGSNTINTKCVISWNSFITLFEGCTVLLNNLLLSREEMLEDRWPCYMQCYKTLILCLCERAKTEDDTDISIELKLAEMAHSIEKLTQSICKRKTHVSRISAYAVADICSWMESNFPPKVMRQRLENTVAMLIQVSDSTYAMSFLKRALAGSVGQMTMTNIYTLYKRYHKYVGNA
ncbi:hypothetical protein KGM_205497 [Danaus plexippus plexippus]|uniref:Nucleolar 27S pre-rRNA processing Urb2/Npa2 C-terminal domain-containing protein n=1 Tax=Danaus plexippus plexippus TaxID=278856 RepID=A0A212EKN9_DANPL|nr:hypothetical protein KGM_205497 [Danaus plexippus plexippus]